MRSRARVLVLALLASVSFGGSALAERTQEPAANQSTVSSITTAATDGFIDLTVRGRDERAP